MDRVVPRPAAAAAAALALAAAALAAAALADDEARDARRGVPHVVVFRRRSAGVVRVGVRVRVPAAAAAAAAAAVVEPLEVGDGVHVAEVLGQVPPRVALVAARVVPPPAARGEGA